MGQNTRIPPHSIEAESAVIGIMLCYPDSRARVRSEISSEAFYQEAHGLIFTAIVDSEGGDTLAVINLLRRKGNLEKVGGTDYIFKLAMDVGTSTTLSYHIKEILDLYQARSLLSAISSTTESVFAGFSAGELIADLRNRLREIEALNVIDKPENNKDIINAVLDDVDERMRTGRREVGVLTGLDLLDRNLMGLEPKTLNIIMARPSVGKTALALNISDNISMAGAGTVVFFSLEMGKEAVTRRSLASESNVFLSKIRSGDLSDWNVKELLEAAGKLSERDLIVFDKPKYRVVEDLCGMSEKLASENKLALVIIDHIQKMRSRIRFNSRHLEVSYISNELKALAVSLNIPVIALSQLNRKVEERANKRPELAFLKESGDLEQDADCVLGLYRDGNDSEEMEVACLKARDASLFKGVLNYNRFIQRIRD